MFLHVPLSPKFYLKTPPHALAGDLLSWQSLAWKEGGDWSLVQEEELEEDRVCNGGDTYDMPIKVDVTQDEGVETCKKLTNGTLSPAPTSTEELLALLKWFEKETKEPEHECHNIWTPLSDAEAEGDFRSLVDGSKPAFLPWSPNYGNKGPQYNSVAIYVPEPETPYYDAGATSTACISCTVSVDLTLRLKGLCAESVLGKDSRRKDSTDSFLHRCEVRTKSREAIGDPCWLQLY